jgi:DnaJ family protein A protein 2
VNIEKGMRNKDKIRFRGMSDDVPNAEPGDILFILQEKDHPTFTRKNNDLLIKKDLTLQEALCGYEFPVTHLDGRKIIVKSQPGEIIRPDGGSATEPFVKCVEDEGMPKKGSPFEKGRLFIYFRIVFPSQGSLSASAIKALKTALPAPTPPEPYDPDETEVVHADLVDLQDFGKKDATGGDAYDSDDGEEGRGGVQCQQG